MKLIRPSLVRRLLDLYWTRLTTPNPNPLNQPTIVVNEDGFIPCSSAQPQFDRLVRVKLTLPSGRYCFAFGTRTAIVDAEVGQERWDVTHCANPEEFYGKSGITHWKPL